MICSFPFFKGSPYDIINLMKTKEKVLYRLSPEERKTYKGKVIRVKQKHKKSRNIPFKIFIGLLILAVVGTVVFVGKIYFDVQGTISQVHTTAYKTKPVPLSKTQPFSTLIVGTSVVDGQKVIKTAMAAVVNPVTQKTTIVNIDPMKLLPDHDSLALEYQVGGVLRLKNKVQSMLGITFNEALTLDLDGFGDFAEATGGITIQNPTSFVMNGYQFPKGSLLLTTRAEITAYLSPVNVNDTPYLEARQQNVGMAIFTNLKKMPTMGNYQQLLYALKKNTTSSLNTQDFIDLVLYYRSSLAVDKINLHSVAYAGQGGDLQIFPADQIANAKSLINQALEK